MRVSPWRKRARVPQDTATYNAWRTNVPPLDQPVGLSFTNKETGEIMEISLTDMEAQEVGRALLQITGGLIMGTPDMEQRAAVRRFARKQGGRWKAELHICWMNAAYPDAPEADKPLLQQVRNQFGPLWLEKVTLKDLEP